VNGASTPAPGDADVALERLYDLHRAEVFRFVLRAVGDREEAEDVTQATFLNAYRALARGCTPRHPRAWLLAIAENVRRTRLRGRRDELPLALVEATAAAAEPTVDAAEIRDALERLPASQREAVVLRELAGLSYAEIGEALGVSVGSVQMLVFRGRRALRAQLAGTRGRGAAALLPSLQGRLQGWLQGWLQGPAVGGGPAIPRAAAAAAGVAALGVAVPGSAPVAPPVPAPRGLAPSPPVAHVARATARPAAPVTTPLVQLPASKAAGAPEPATAPTAPAPPEESAPPGAAVAVPTAVEGGGGAGASPVTPAPPELSLPAPAPAVPPPPQVEAPAVLPQLDAPSPEALLDDATGGDPPLPQLPAPSTPVTSGDGPLVEVDAPDLPILSP
jgi:RNA polymerase sigma factor (sigma-70 family)